MGATQRLGRPVRVKHDACINASWGKAKKHKLSKNNVN